MDRDRLISFLNSAYTERFTRAELLREGGSSTYTLYSGEKRYLLKYVGTAFRDSVIASSEVQLYLRSRSFPVPQIVLSGDGKAYAEYEGRILLLYEYLELEEIDMESDAEAVGALIGRLHALMSAYDGKLTEHDKGFYVERYLAILKKKQYARASEFQSLGEKLWSAVKDLPRGFCHGDLYCGNIMRAKDGTLYVMDFDSVCIGFPMYDLALICNRTDYFSYDPDGMEKTRAMFERFLPEYEEQCRLSIEEKHSLYNLLALYHFALQATIIELYGLNCVDAPFFDRQLSWLNRWVQQSPQSAIMRSDNA